VAVALLDGAVSLESFEPKKITDPRLVELIQKISVSRNKELSAQYPEASPNEVRIELRSGKVLQRRVTYGRGHPKNPMTDTEVEAKFRGLARPILSEQRMDQVLETMWKLEEVSKLGSLFSMFSER
jgi:2-methylcitrate dehydratase